MSRDLSSGWRMTHCRALSAREGILIAYRNNLKKLGERMTTEERCTVHWVCSYLEIQIANERKLTSAWIKNRRRARKARKNLVMYKTAGRRPWTDNNGVLYSSKAGVERMAQNGDDALSIAARYRNGPKLHMHHRQLHLRERTGFLAMSRLAEGMR